MDLREGRLILETERDYGHVSGGTDRIGGIFSLLRGRELLNGLPSQLTASETMDVIVDLRNRVDLGSRHRASSEERISAGHAGETLATIAQLGILASSHEGSNARLVQQVVEAIGGEQGSAEEQTEADPLDNVNIGEMELGSRSYNKLKRAGIETVGDLTRITRETLNSLPGLGTKDIQEIEDELLRQHGKRLRSEDDEEPK